MTERPPSSQVSGGNRSLCTSYVSQKGPYKVQRVMTSSMRERTNSQLYHSLLTNSFHRADVCSGQICRSSKRCFICPFPFPSQIGRHDCLTFGFRCRSRLTLGVGERRQISARLIQEIQPLHDIPVRDTMRVRRCRAVLSLRHRRRWFEVKRQIR